MDSLFGPEPGVEQTGNIARRGNHRLPFFRLVSG